MVLQFESCGTAARLSPVWKESPLVLSHHFSFSSRRIHPPHQLCSISHVRKCEECYHPSPISCVASHMCASARNATIPTPPHQLQLGSISKCASARNVIIPTPPHQLHSISHACKCKEPYHLHPTPHMSAQASCFPVKYTGATGRYQQLT